MKRLLPARPERLSLPALILLGLLCHTAFAQSKLDVSGYVKVLGTFNHVNPDFFPPVGVDIPGSYEDYLIHNRFDLKYYAGKRLSLGAGMRNRLFWGYRTENDPAFYSALDADRGLLDLSFLYWKSDQILLHTVFDRAWAQWESDKWIVRLGRQRINWGVNTVWNPNDIFNQYNYLDFDYEERPGSDALRVQYFPNFKNSLELGVSPARDLEKSVAAALYKFNKWQYDFQFLAGYYRQDLVAGTGWAGNIENAGFKGEVNYYYPLTDNTESNFTASLSGDYQFGFGLYTQVSYLYNGLGSASPNVTDFLTLNSELQSAKNIFPFRHTAFLQLGYNITPLFRADWATMVSPDLNNIILFPTLTYSVRQNLDALLAVQFFMSDNPLEENRLQWLSGFIFARLKYSF